MPRYNVGFWNLENLFSPEGDPNREAWIAQRLAAELNGWTQAIFDQKVSQLSSIIAMMGGGQGPDLLGVCEVENAPALQALADSCNARLGNRNYQIVHADAARDRRGIDTAFLFDAHQLTVDPATVFSHFVMRRTGTRDITQATFATAAGNELIALANHWPSRSGGASESAGFRITAGETLSYWHERIRDVKGVGAAIVALGDFNDDPHDTSLRVHARAWRERGDVLRARSGKFYNLSWQYLTKNVQDVAGNQRVIDGTLYYNNDGNVFDQIMVSRGLLGGAFHVVESTATVDAFSVMTSHRTGEGPIRFGRPSSNLNQNGYSDHFPVSVQISENE